LGHLLRDGVDGLYARPGDPADMAAALKRLRNEPGLAARIGRNARASIVSSMTTEHFTTRLERICVSSRRAKPRTEFFLIPGVGAAAQLEV
jgi:glycosyltransferase involved in cell wall biosynthesis